MAKQRARSRILLLLCFVSLFGLSSALRGMESNAERLGALCVPVGLYAAGAWFAFKDGARGAAIVLGLMIFGGLGFGVVKGLRRAAGNAEVNRELADARAKLAQELATDGDDLAAVQDYAARMSGVASKLRQSESRQDAAIGRLLERAAELRAPIETRMTAAIEAVSSERFLDVPRMLADGDFDWQRKAAEEYEHAAHAAFDFYGRLPKVLEAELAGSGLPKQAQEDMRAGMERTRTLTIRICQGHGRAAGEYTRLIEFLAENGAQAEVAEDGTVRFSTVELSTAYDAIWERLRDAEQKLDDAITALHDALSH